MSNGMTTVGISDMQVIKGAGTLITYALGSCIGICLYDSVVKVAGMVHIMLPVAPSGNNQPCKYANTGIPALISKMETMGASRRRMKAKIAGGAKMFEIMGDSTFGNIGQRNIVETRLVLKALKIPIIGEKVGSNHARTLVFFVENGSAKIRMFGADDIVF